MSANSLLLWMSARREGSWAQFRAAVEELHLEADAESQGEDEEGSDQYALPLYQALRFNLQRVGHAEFFAGAGDEVEWRVTPPSLALTLHAQGQLGVLAGARSPALMERLRSAVAAETANLQTLGLPAYPDQVLITAGNRSTLTSIAERTGLSVQPDAPASLLASLPPVDDPNVRWRAELPFGVDWRIDRFSPDDLVWRGATLDDARSTSGGLFRFSLRHQRHILFCRKGLASRIPGQVGKYLVLHRRRRQVLRYDIRGRVLSAPASCRPPFLVERALILCSGSPPSYEGGQRGGLVSYTAIPEAIALMAASVLRQELR